MVLVCVHKPVRGEETFRIEIKKKKEDRKEEIKKSASRLGMEVETACCRRESKRDSAGWSGVCEVDGEGYTV